MPPWTLFKYALIAWYVEIGPSWWSAIFTLLGAMATFSAVVTAFVLQAQQARRERQRKRDEELRVEVSAIKSCEAGLSIYDSIFHPDEPPENRSRSDTSKRLLMMKGMIDRYAGAVIHDVGILSMIVTAQTLLSQAAEDIQALPTPYDRVEFQTFHEIGEHRKALADGLRAMIEQIWARPAYPWTTGQTRP